MKPGVHDVVMRVTVEGRRGVGRRTVEAALRRRGVDVVAAEPDVRVRVVAETLKPEDVHEDEVPTLVVQTKADLTEAVCGARMVGLLAVLDPLTDVEVDALRVLVEQPADMTSVDAFASCVHPLSRQVRMRLLERLDLFGIAHAVLAFADGADPADVVTRLTALSGVDEVLTALHALAAPARYRRVDRETGCATAVHDDIAVLARMAAAVDVVESAGVPVDRGARPEDHRHRALHWARYARGPVNDLHRACATDIVRGSLRLLDGAQP